MTELFPSEIITNQQWHTTASSASLNRTFLMVRQCPIACQDVLLHLHLSKTQLSFVHKAYKDAHSFV